MIAKERPLTDQEKAIYKPYFASNVIEQARIIDGRVPFWLSRKMCAVVLKHRIYFRQGYYQPNTPQGVALLGHELAHVSQFLHGMSYLKYIWSCRKGYHCSPYEVDAYAKGQLISTNYHQNTNILQSLMV